jgi:MFS family permease
MLSDESLPQTKARVFGFHRAMDTLGAVFGPALALLYLHFHPENYKALFLLSVFPGVAVILISFLLRESKKTVKAEKTPQSFCLSFIIGNKVPKNTGRSLLAY